MHRFYFDRQVEGEKIVIDDSGQVHHIRDVLRLKPGDEVIVFDSAGSEYAGTITGLAENQVFLLASSKRAAPAAGVEITIACALPKRGKLEDIIDSLTQLGVDRVVPIETERVEVRLDEARKAARLARWRKVAQAAAQQSQRHNVPVVEPVTPFDELIKASGRYELRLIAALIGERRHIREILDAAVRPRSLLALIGPEGDFTPDEVARALAAGFVPVSLGESVLRVATAAAALMSYIRLTLLP